SCGTCAHWKGQRCSRLIAFLISGTRSCPFEPPAIESSGKALERRGKAADHFEVKQFVAACFGPEPIHKTQESCVDEWRGIVCSGTCKSPSIVNEKVEPLQNGRRRLWLIIISEPCVTPVHVPLKIVTMQDACFAGEHGPPHDVAHSHLIDGFHTLKDAE